jgi:alpha-mannosidase
MDDTVKDFTVHMIGNAHIDPIWLWRMREGYEEVINTCRTALQLMREYPGFIFSRSSAITYKWIEENEPEMFEEIRRRVKEGRWNIVNGWWVQPDCNIPCGESFVRHSLYGKRYFKEKFGVEVKVGYNVDSFGHCATLPQILKKSGLDCYLFFRPKPDEKELPPLFWWESPDGTRVLTCRPPHHYNSGPDELETRIWEAFRERPEGIKDVMCFYGVGDHGGGPTRRNIESIIKANKRPDYPTVIFSTPDAFFERALLQKRDFPIVAEELQYHSRGCYTAYSKVKRQNRRAESLLLTAEKFSSIAFWFLGKPYPQAELTKAWQNVLFCQFHDILAGTCIKEAYDEDVEKLYDETFSLARKALDDALSSIAGSIKLPEGRNLILFNPVNWRRKEGVEVELKFKEGEKVRLVNPFGREVPYQISDGKLLFIAEVPSMRWAIYRIEEAEEDEDWREFSGLRVSPTRIDNEYYAVQIDPRTGFISSIFDKTCNVEMLSGPGNVPIVIDDPSDTWSHGVDAYRSEIGRFLIEGEPEVVENGPVRATIRIRSRWGNSSVETLISLWDGLPMLDFRMTVDWHERHKMLKLSFPINLSDPIATYEVPYGNVTREPNGNEEPHQRWTDVTGKAVTLSGEEILYGVSLINDCKYGSDIRGSEMRLSLIRSPIYAFHDPAVPDPNKTYDYLDQGIQTIRYRLISHTAEWLERTVKEGYNLNYPIIPRLKGGHDGIYLPFSLDITPGNIIVTTLKKAEDDDSLILRFYECSGRSGVARLSLSYELSYRPHFEIPFGRYEIKTLKLTRDGRWLKIAETDLLER